MRASLGPGLAVTLLALAFVQPCVASSSPKAEPAEAPAFLSFIYSPSLPTFPPSSKAPVVRSLVAVDVPPGALQKAPWCAPGHVELILDATGRVTSVRFSSDTDPGPLGAPIRAALRQWQFEPVFASGESKEVVVTLSYFVVTSNVSAETTGAAPPSPRLTYSVEPYHPPVFFRGVEQMEPIYVEARRPQQTVQMVPARPGSNQLVPVVTTDRYIGDPSGMGMFAYSRTLSPHSWLQARVATRFDVDADGRPGNIRVVDSTCALIEPEAIAAVRSWRFAPAPGVASAEAREVTESVIFDAPQSGLPDGFIQPVPEERKRPKWKTPPRFSRFTLPVYPTVLARAKKAGEAIARVSLDGQGHVTDIHIVKAKHEEFGFALREAILGCSFTPAENDAGPVAAVIQLTARFSPHFVETKVSDPRMPALVLEADPRAVVPAHELDHAPRMLVGRMPVLRSTGVAPQTAVSGTLEFVIDPTGRVREPLVIDASIPEAGYAAVQAAASWLFEPPTMDGKPVAARIRVPFGTTPERTER